MISSLGSSWKFNTAKFSYFHAKLRLRSSRESCVRIMALHEAGTENLYRVDCSSSLMVLMLMYWIEFYRLNNFYQLITCGHWSNIRIEHDELYSSFDVQISSFCLVLRWFCWNDDCELFVLNMPPSFHQAIDQVNESNQMMHADDCVGLPLIGSRVEIDVLDSIYHGIGNHYRSIDWGQLLMVLMPVSLNPFRFDDFFHTIGNSIE